METCSRIVEEQEGKKADPLHREFPESTVLGKAETPRERNSEITLFNRELATDLLGRSQKELVK
jgi:hypothetical protein